MKLKTLKDLEGTRIEFNFRDDKEVLDWFKSNNVSEDGDYRVIIEPIDVDRFALKQEAVKWVCQLEEDFSEGSKKPLLIPQNNREYWLFTEFRQFLMDRFNLNEEDLK